MEKTYRDVQQEITDTIIRQIEAGAGKWQMPWHVKPGEGFGGAMPVNQDGRNYRGLNVILLWGAAMEKGYSRSIWGTFKAWQAKKAFPRKGEKATLCFFWDKILDKKHARENPEKEPKFIFFCKAYNLFNIEQLGEVPAKYDSPITAEPASNEGERIAAAESYFAAIPVDVRHGGGRAYYSPGGDFIGLPEFDRFNTPADYYSTRGHETVHATGHKTRCDRDFSGRFGTESYAFEELVAELGAAFLCGHLGISNEPREDHAQYLANWLKVLKNDKKAIFTAASKAQAAVDYLNNLAATETKGEESDGEGEGERIAA